MLYWDPSADMARVAASASSSVAVKSLSVDSRTENEKSGNLNPDKSKVIDIADKKQFRSYDLTRQELPYFLAELKVNQLLS